MKTINDISLNNKTVVLRCDYNVPVENNKMVDNSKIKASLKTINYLLDHNCRVVILSHFGRIKTIEDKSNNSLKIVAKELANLLKRKVKFIDSTSEFSNSEIIAAERIPEPAPGSNISKCFLVGTYN